MWQPTQAVLTPRAIADNLLTFATNETRQKEALSWAGDSSLKLIKTYSKSVANRLTPVYPSIAFLDDNDAKTIEQSTLTGAYSVTFEVSVQDRDADNAVVAARKYAKAYESMMANCPTATLLNGTGAQSGSLASVETNFDPIKTNDSHNDFLQQFQIRVMYQLWA